MVVLAVAQQLVPELERVVVFHPGHAVGNLHGGADLRRGVRSPGLLEVGRTANQSTRDGAIRTHIGDAGDSDVAQYGLGVDIQRRRAMIAAESTSEFVEQGGRD